MLEKLANLIPTKRTRDLALTAGGMAALLAGRKVVGLGMFLKGAWGIEQSWREKHPDFEGGFDARWQRAVEFYESTHRDGMNRKLHMVGIPMIAGGAAGLLLFKPFRPLWLASASSFTVGWALNIVGHGVFEKNAPAFADDPLSFLAGPIWDLQQLRKRGGAQQTSTDDAQKPQSDVVDATFSTVEAAPASTKDDGAQGDEADINVGGGAAQA